MDERSISDVRPDELTQYTQCHFFAGIGIWALALKDAGWPTARPIWTGSCPCQPFSEIGTGSGFADERHLWPHFHHLVEQCRPPVIVGEQVASTLGLEWLDLVLSDLESSGYSATAFDLCAAGFGAPHIRQRLFWVGDTEHAGLEGYPRDVAVRAGRPETNRPVAEAGLLGAAWANADWLWYADGKTRPSESGISPMAHVNPNRVGVMRAYGNALVAEVASEFVSAYMDVLGG